MIRSGHAPADSMKRVVWDSINIVEQQSTLVGDTRTGGRFTGAPATANLVEHDYRIAVTEGEGFMDPLSETLNS